LHRKPLGIAIALLCFLAIAILRLPLLGTMLVLAPISVLASWTVDKGENTR
jgi:chromate transporter